MSVTTIKAEQVAAAGVGLLERAVVLPRLVWTDAVGDFRGAKNDTITLKLPAYFQSSKRLLRSGDSRTKGSLYERSIDVKLDTDVYGDVPITDEELNLDIADFGVQVLAPTLSGIARGLEDELIEEITGADYANEIGINVSDPYKTIISAREKLNNARVPMDGRAIVCGSAVETALLQSDRLSLYLNSGGTDALRGAQVGRIGGFDVISVPGLPVDESYAFHRSAYILATRAPAIPAGAPWGATESANGFAVRTVRVFDVDEVEDRFILDSWVGTAVTTDFGTVSDDGIFTPATGEDDSGADDYFVRAVKMTLGS